MTIERISRSNSPAGSRSNTSDIARSLYGARSSSDQRRRPSNEHPTGSQYDPAIAFTRSLYRAGSPSDQRRRSSNEHPTDTPSRLPDEQTAGSQSNRTDFIRNIYEASRSSGNPAVHPTEAQSNQSDVPALDRTQALPVLASDTAGSSSNPGGFSGDVVIEMPTVLQQQALSSQPSDRISVRPRSEDQPREHESLADEAPRDSERPPVDAQELLRDLKIRPGDIATAEQLAQQIYDRKQAIYAATRELEASKQALLALSPRSESYLKLIKEFRPLDLTLRGLFPPKDSMAAQETRWEYDIQTANQDGRFSSLSQKLTNNKLIRFLNTRLGRIAFGVLLATQGSIFPSVVEKGVSPAYVVTNLINAQVGNWIFKKGQESEHPLFKMPFTAFWDSAQWTIGSVSGHYMQAAMNGEFSHNSNFTTDHLSNFTTHQLGDSLADALGNFTTRQPTTSEIRQIFDDYFDHLLTQEGHPIIIVRPS